jgi:FkbM family methyltransferase
MFGVSPVFRLLKSPIDKHLPFLAHLYRLFREEVGYRQMKPIIRPEGFRFVSPRSMQTGEFESTEIEIIKEKLGQADLLVDIGANVGLYTCIARSLGKHVIAIEPHAQNLRLLYRNLEENGWHDVEVWPIGVGDASGTVTMYGGGTGASIIRGWAGIPESWKQTIAVHTLDNLVGARFPDKRIVIKVDVEGGEYAVLQGALNTIKRTIKPTWLVEITLTLHHPDVNRRFMQSFDIFWSNGYEARTGDEARRLVTRSDVERWVNNGKCDFGTHNWLFATPGRL